MAVGNDLCNQMLYGYLLNRTEGPTLEEKSLHRLAIALYHPRDPSSRKQALAVTRLGAFDWGLTEFLTIATPQGIKTVANPRQLRNQLGELKRLAWEVSRKIRMAQSQSGKQKAFPVSANLCKTIQHLSRLHAKVVRQRKDFLHQMSNWLVKQFGAITIEALVVKNMVRSGGSSKKGLNREIHAVAPAAFLHMVRTKA